MDKKEFIELFFNTLNEKKGEDTIIDFLKDIFNLSDIKLANIFTALKTEKKLKIQKQIDELNKELIK